MKHTAEAWDHEIFKDILTKVNSAELCYQSIHFYLEYAPGHLTDLMATMSSRVDNERVVHELRKAKQLPLGKAYLETTQESNLKGVNEALNEMYIDEEDFESLRMSIDNFDNFDQLALAEKLKKHELLEFRRIAAALYKVWPSIIQWGGGGENFAVKKGGEILAQQFHPSPQLQALCLLRRARRPGEILPPPPCVEHHSDRHAAAISGGEGRMRGTWVAISRDVLPASA